MFKIFLIEDDPVLKVTSTLLIIKPRFENIMIGQSDYFVTGV